MRDWGLMLGGLLVWTLHFLGVYGVASVADLSDPSTHALWRGLGLALTGLCLLAVALIALRARPSTRDAALYRQVGLGTCAVSFIAIVWQSVPLIVST
ncbi:hypothetical protein [Brevundimonas sp. SL161]|uniref:hypothetical protein n=1 Tax=Brevundimonas sp. SL161 TaxID=2804613 RepID=UPI003CECE111